MPSVTHDGRSFMIDGRRVWLASGRVPYARICREQWSERILAAKHAGLNTIETPVFWNRHEIRSGKFDFQGDNDLRHFVDLIGKHGMYCILNIGPYVNSGWDMGGLPAFLREGPASGLLRTAIGNSGGAFLEACSRYITAVSDQVRGWQITAQGTGGPIIMLQVESEWTCGRETLANSYLGELTRYCREAGLNVPIVNSNNLWQSVEGQIDGWAGSEDMLATMRQLVSVRPDHPRMVIDFASGEQRTWSESPQESLGASTVERRLAEVLAGGGQFNLTTFCGGTNFGFFGGRTADGTSTFATARADHGCAISEFGGRTELYAPVRRVAHLASRFARVFASLDPVFQAISLCPGDAADAYKNASAKRGAKVVAASGSSVVHVSGPQGGVAFVFRDNAETDAELTLLLADGTTLPVPARPGSTVWCLMGVNITARGRLDYSNISAFGAIGQSLVLFGPAGSRAVVSVNGSPLETNVPTGENANVIEHEGITLVIVNDAVIDRTVIGEDAIHVGVAGLKPDGTPIPLAGTKSYMQIGMDGRSKTVKVDAASAATKRNARLSLHGWSHASCEDHVEGTSARYASIAGPADLVGLGVPYGYGWYRLTPRESIAKTEMAFPNAGDRLHIFSNGKRTALVGVGPGAETTTGLAMKEGSSLVVLADNLGRFCEGSNLGEGKGLFGEVFAIKNINAGKPKLVQGRPIEVLTVRAPLWELSDGDATSPERITWSVPHKKKTPVLMTIDAPPAGALLIVNDKSIAFLDKSGPRHVLLSADDMGKGNNQVQIALVVHGEAASELKRLSACVSFAECADTVLDKCDLSFARWEPPASGQFTAKGAVPKGTPCWWKCTIQGDPHGEGAYIELGGMTKGQIYLNGRHVSRYFVADPAGKALPGQSRYMLPAPWLKAGGNELMLFDEHGGNPSRVRISTTE